MMTPEGLNEVDPAEIAAAANDDEVGPDSDVATLEDEDAKMKKEAAAEKSDDEMQEAA